MTLDDSEPAARDVEVAQGPARRRSEAVRRGIARRQGEQRYRAEEETSVGLSRRGEAVYPDLTWDAPMPHPSLD